MCGIVGFTGTENAVPIVLKGLTVLEYRGYDSVGLAGTLKGEILLSKCKGRVDELRRQLKEENFPKLNCAIGHTRWATHGGPSNKNAHPHKTDVLALVHNGIIENYRELKEELIKDGVKFLSETDTEVAAQVISKEYKRLKNPVKAIYSSVNKFKGSYAFEIIFNDFDGEIFAVREGSPLILGQSDDGGYLASDITALLPYTKSLYFLEEGEMAHITKDTVKIVKEDLSEILPTFKTTDISQSSAEKDGYEHFMLKEMHEQSSAVYKTVKTRITKNGLPDLANDGVSDQLLKRVGKIHIVACGSAMHAGLVGKYYIERFAQTPTSVEIASEFRYNAPLIDEKTLVIIVSQSGETADSLAALRYAKAKGAFTLGIVNVVGSTIAREANAVFYTHAGPEIAVATTKGYCVQLAAFMLLSLSLSLFKGTVPQNTVKLICWELLNDLPLALEETLKMQPEIKGIAHEFYSTEHLFYIGRGIDYSLILEGSLKLKEISYIHSEAYAAGELKHGTISLIEDGTPVFALSTSDELYDKTVSNIRECMSRGAKVLFICHSDAVAPESAADVVLKLPKVSKTATPFCAMAAMQLLAYEIAKKRGCDIDKPRNLAKSVTVE